MKHAVIACLIVASLISAYILFKVSTDGNGIRAVCWDGSVSKSKTNRGTCSNHGGVARWIKGD